MDTLTAPYVTLGRVDGKPCVQVSYPDRDTKNFEATEAGAKEAVAYLVGLKSNVFMIGVPLDFPGEHGVDFDIQACINAEWKRLRQPIAWWVFATHGDELMHYGKNADTTEPYTTEEEAVDQAKYLDECGGDDRIYIARVFANGHIMYQEYDRTSKG